MKRVPKNSLLVLFLSVCPVAAFAQATKTRAIENTDRLAHTQSSQTVNAASMAGVEAGAKISAAIALLPPGGGVVDASGLIGAQVINSRVNIPEQVTVLLGPATFTFSGQGQFVVNAVSALKGQALGLSNKGTLFTTHTPGLSVLVVYNGTIGAIVENISFDGLSRAGAVGPAITFASGKNSSNRNYFRNMSINTWRGTGILLEGAASDNHFDNITMSDTGDEKSKAPSIDLQADANSNMFSNVQIDSHYYAGIRENSRGANIFVNLKLDSNSAPAGTHNIIFTGSAQFDRFTNFIFRADAQGVGDCIRIDGTVKDIGFTNGYCWRGETPGRGNIGFNLNNSSATGVQLTNVLIQGFAVGIRDIASLASVNSYQQIRFANNTTAVSLGNFQPLSSIGTKDGAQDDFSLLTVADLIRSNRTDNNLIFQTKANDGGQILFQDAAGHTYFLVDTATGMPQLPAKTFVRLGTPPNGSLTFCQDCARTDPCVGRGSGAIAKRLNNGWVCN